MINIQDIETEFLQRFEENLTRYLNLKFKDYEDIKMIKPELIKKWLKENYVLCVDACEAVEVDDK